MTGATLASQADPKWLFIGASGRIGRMVLRAWQQNPPAGVQIVPQIRHAPDDALAPAVTPGMQPLIWDPAQGPEALARYVAAQGPVAGMFVFAGVTPGGAADFRQNVDICVQCLQAAQECDIPSVFVASSSAVYGLGPQMPMTEATGLAPLNDYGASKVAAEAACRAHRGAQPAKIVQLRIGNVVGADSLSINAQKRDPAQPMQLDQFADGQGPCRSYIGPVSLAHALIALAKNPRAVPDILNLGAPVPVQMQSLLDCIGANWDFVPARPQAHQTITIDCATFSALAQLPDTASSARQMVQEWEAVRDPV